MSHKIVRTSGGHPAVTPRRLNNDHAVALRMCKQFSDVVYIGYHQLFFVVVFFHFNICLQTMSLIPPGAHRSSCCFGTATDQTGTQGADSLVEAVVS